jgi:hypothetical protein
MMYRIEDFKNDPNWKPSFGEKLGKVHFRNGNWHAECNPQTGFCDIHYDEIDPHESPESMVKHMWDSKLGKGVLITAGIAILDHFLNDGKLRKSMKRSLFG